MTGNGASVIVRRDGLWRLARLKEGVSVQEAQQRAEGRGELLLEVLEEADRSHAMVKVGDGRVTFAHENLQRVIYDSMTEARRNEIHREVARILEAERTTV